MFERFTHQARQATSLAEDEARLLHHNSIDTAHLLLGLIREGNGVAARALESLGVTLERARLEVGEIIRPSRSPRVDSLPLTPRAKKVLELSHREANQLGHDYVGTEHVLLGLVREGEGVGAQVLVSLRADLSMTRRRVMEILLDDRLSETTAVAVVPAPIIDGPRCPGCSQDLEVAFRVIDATPDSSMTSTEARRLTIVYCRHCGTTLAALDPPSAQQ
jgi:ATP-dependent Clp protease ATP-binding subunit ClpC